MPTSPSSSPGRTIARVHYENNNDFDDYISENNKKFRESTSNESNTTNDSNNELKPFNIRGRRSSKSFSEKIVEMPNALSLADISIFSYVDIPFSRTAWILFYICVAPLISAICIAIIPMQNISEGIWHNYTWWYQVWIDFFVYSFFIVGLMLLLMGKLPLDANYKYNYLFTLMIYGCPHMLMFPLIAETIVWPIPFSIYLICGGIYLFAIIVNYYMIVVPEIERLTLEHMNTSLATSMDGGQEYAEALLLRGKFMVVQFFAQAVIIAIFVGYRALFSLQTSLVQVLMVPVFLLLEYGCQYSLNKLIQHCQFPGTNYTQVAGFAFMVLVNLFKTFLFPAINEYWMFAFLVIADSGPIIYGLYITSDSYVGSRGRRTSLSTLDTETLTRGQSIVDLQLDKDTKEEDQRVLNTVTEVLLTHLSKSLAPIFFIVIVGLLWLVNRPHVFMFDNVTQTQFHQSLIFAVIDFTIQIAIYIGYCMFLRRRNISPLKVILAQMNDNKNLWYYTLQISVNIILMMFVLIRHFGCDFEFKFDWI